MPNGQPNIVFVVLDMLRAASTGYGGRSPTLTPNFDKVARKGRAFTRHFSTGCPTQIAFPGLFTSTLPLDHGGYNSGIKKRPVAFPEILAGAGYTTFGVTPAQAVSKYWGYDKGFDQFINLIDMVHWFRGASITLIDENIHKWTVGELSDQDISAFITDIFASVLRHGLEYLDDLDRVGAPERGIKRDQWRLRIDVEMTQTRTDPLAVARKMKTLGSSFHHSIGRAEADDDLLASLERANRRAGRLNRYMFLSAERHAYQAHDVNDQMARFLKQRPQKPFAAFLHFLDIHESKMLVPTLEWRRARHLPGDILRARRSWEKFHLGAALYDFGVSYADREFGRLVRMIEKAGLADDTVFVVTADHGAEHQLHRRGVGSDLSRMFYDDFLHVPLIISGGNVEAGVDDALSSNLDIAPTICELAGEVPDSSFQGTSLFGRSDDPAAYVSAENTGKGQCDVRGKPIYHAHRNERLKLIFETNGGATEEREVFDLSVDPQERNNIAASEDFLTERAAIKKAVGNRLTTVMNGIQH